MPETSNPFDDPVINEQTDAYFDELNENNDVLDNEHDVLDMYNMTPRQRVVYAARKMGFHLANQFYALELWKKIIVVVAGMCFLALGVVLLVFHNAILHKLVETSNELKEKSSTQFILLLLIYIVGFPPLIGYSFLSTSTGLLYGVSFHGWFVLALGTVAGSLSSFALFQNILHSRAEKLVHMNKRFEAFASILQENNSYWYLALLRLCPFPYSLTNGAIAGVYGISLRNFAIANLITTPKLLIYLFIGSRIKSLGETESTGSRLFDIASIVVTVAIFTMTAWLLYFKTQQRYNEIKNKASQMPVSHEIDLNDPATFEI